jgi:glycosyltransferase involved in cell wall biosynthesis
MRAVHVVPSIAAEASGPSYTVPTLCRALARETVDVELAVLAPAPPTVDREISVHAYSAWPILSRLGISPSMRRGLRDAARRADIIHNHSLWMMPNIYPRRAVRGTRCRLVVSPRGTLSSWSLGRSRWAKRVIWWTGQRAVLRAAACVHATSEDECTDVRRLGINAPVCIIPNGIEIPSTMATARPSGRRRLLFLSRIHVKKGIDFLLGAWRRLQDTYPDWELDVVGPDNGGHLAEVQSLAADLGVERVRFVGPVYGDEKAECYRRADLFVLPTRSENFGMAVAEALAHGLPAIVSKGAPWSGLETHGCGWWIDIGEGPLTDALRDAMARPASDLSARGVRGREWMEREYSWSRVGRMMHDTYAWLIGGGSVPPWVRVAA